MRHRILILTAFAVLLLCAAQQPARAQRAHTLTIHDGQVAVDGRPVPPERLPASLDLAGIDARYSFSGDLKPVVALGGRFYALDEEGLHELVDDMAPAPAAHGEAASKAGDHSVFVRTQAPGVAFDVMRPFDAGSFSVFSMSFEEDAGLADVRGHRVRTPEVVFMQRQARALAQQAGGLQALREELHAKGDFRHVQQIEQHAHMLREQAAETARMAQEMPFTEVRSYLDDLQRDDHALFERLVRERDMEAETLRLAHEISALPEGAARDERVATLRQRLREIFELKQENRRREIVQLERQLTGLQDRLQERERLRDRIIENRLHQLLDAYLP